MIRFHRGAAEVWIAEDAPSLARAAAEEIVRVGSEAVAARGRFLVALSGGATPGPVYELLARDYARALDWSRAVVFWSDERCVPPADARSNYRFARSRFLERVPVQPAQVYRIRGEDDPAAAAAAYERALRTVLAAGPQIAPTASFDLALLGLGSDGHTASLFPGRPAVRESDRWVLADEITGLGARVTLTPAVLNLAREVMFLVEGTPKADVVQRVLEGPCEPGQLPAQAIRPATGRTVWVLDRPAAARLAVPGGQG